MLSRVIKTVEEASALIREGSHFTFWGGASKGGLRALTEGAMPLDMRRFTGIVEYEPDEYTFTAKAGTTMAEIIDTLAKSGQYLPFDPIMPNRMATLGGCIAAGISGPGRFRYGGLRDFIIGIKFIDGHGRLIKGGGKVVKNAAGFDFPKLMVGSCGRLGLITEATFKVFPKPQSTLTAMVALPLLTKALETVRMMARMPFDLDALELMPPGEVVIRIAGDANALAARLDAIRQQTGLPWRTVSDTGAAEMWHSLNQMQWVEGFTRRVRVAITPGRVMELDEMLEKHGVTRIYSVGANVAWIAWPPALDIELLHRQLTMMKLSAMQFDGSPVRLGVNPAAPVERIVKQALDPQNKFGSMP